MRDFETARARRQQLTDLGVEAELTADWPLDERGIGDIALRGPPERLRAAEDALGEDCGSLLGTVRALALLKRHRAACQGHSAQGLRRS